MAQEKVNGAENRPIEGFEINFTWDRGLDSLMESVAANGTKTVMVEDKPVQAGNINARYNLADKTWQISQANGLTSAALKTLLNGCESAIAEIKVDISTKLITTTPSA